MEFTNDPTKCKKVFILMLVLSILFFLAAGFLGYLYYAKNKNYRNLQSEKQKLEDQLVSATADLQKQVEDLQKQAEELQKQVKELQGQKKGCDDELASCADKSAKIKKYIAVLDYVVGILGAHGGLVGWTEAEYQQGRGLVQATGDSNLLNVVDAAWNDVGGDQVARLVSVFNAIISGINKNL